MFLDPLTLDSLFNVPPWRCSVGGGDLEDVNSSAWPQVQPDGIGWRWLVDICLTIDIVAVIFHHYFPPAPF